MSAEDILSSGASSPGPPAASQHSTLTSPSEEENGNIEPGEENLQYGLDFDEEGSSEEESLEEGEAPKEKETPEEEKNLEEKDCLDEALRGVCFSEIKSNHMARSPAASTSQGFQIAPSTSAALPSKLEPASEPAAEPSKQTSYSGTPHCVTLRDQASQTEWAYKSKLAFEVSDVEKGEDNALEPLTQGDFWDTIMNEPSDKQPAENWDGKSVPRSYGAMLREIVKKITSRSKIQEDAVLPLSKLLEGENRTKLGILLRNNLEKYKETVDALRRREGQKLAELTTFTYRMSTELKPKEPEAQNMAEDASPSCSEQKIEVDTEWTQKKMKAHQSDGKLVLYPSGSIFQILFPSGTGQIHYPSGNLAILISCTEGTNITYIVLEDNSSMKIRGLINNSGHATFYDENEDIWLSLSQNLGYYFPKNKPQKAWNWWDLSIHVHAPPIKHIFLELNRYIKVQIKSQDKIIFCFCPPKQKRIYFNMGTRYKFIDLKELYAMKKMAILETEPGPTSCKIHVLLEKISKTLTLLTVPEMENFTEDATLILMDISKKRTKSPVCF